MVKSKPTPTSFERNSTNHSDSSVGRRQSSPRQSRSVPDALSDADHDEKKSSSKTPTSILRSGRYQIEIKRTEKNKDGFADDSPYWEAAKRASTQQDSPSQSSSGSDQEEHGPGEQPEGELGMHKKQSAKDLKRKEKQKMKKTELEKLKQEYTMGRSKAKPNFKIGTFSSQSGNSSDDESHDSSEWLKSSLQMNGKNRGRGKAMFSPSDLSRASTIPPTPASSKSVDVGSNKLNGGNVLNQNENVQDELEEGQDEKDNDDFYVSNNYSDEDGDGGSDENDDSGNDEQDAMNDPLSPIHEEEKTSVGGTAGVPPNDEVQELEDNIMDVADKVSMAHNLSKGGDSFHLQEENNDDVSDDMGDDNDQGIGFEVAASQQESSSHSSDDDDKGTDTVQSSASLSSKKHKNEKAKKKPGQQVESVTPNVSQRAMNKKRGRPKKVRISTTVGGTGYQAAPREYRTIPAEDFEDQDEAPDGVRRSKRRRFRPLQFWKNEKIVYEPNHEEGDLAEIFGDMPMVAGVLQAEPTPYKKRNIIRRKNTNRVDDNTDSDDDDGDPKRKGERPSKRSYTDEKPFDSTKLRKKYDIQDGDTAPIWWESKGLTLDKKILCYRHNLKLHELPLSKKRSKKDGKVVAKAAQAFNIEPQDDNMPGYICGCMDVPPLGIKDEEGVGPCSQVFNVGDCQPKSVELAIAHPDINGGNFEADSAKRFLLSKGDMFHIPAGNVYRIQNHSKTTTCTLNWTIIRPPPREEE